MQPIIQQKLDEFIDIDIIEKETAHLLLWRLNVIGCFAKGLRLPDYMQKVALMLIELI